MDGRISNMAQIASITRYTVTHGEAKDLSVIDCNNGKLRFLINESKACDIMQVYHKGVNISFISKNGFTKRELPFASRFEGGMIYTCGLDNAGRREGFEIHGSLHNTPSEVTRCDIQDGTITVEAVMRCTALFGKNLVLRRRITSKLLGDTVTLEDVLTNEGYRDENYCLLYHTNLGYPMLDEGAELKLDFSACESRGEWARENESGMLVASDAVPNIPECCYFLKMRTPTAMLENKRLGKKFVMNYSADTLPCFVVWRSMASGDYALGFEPCTTELSEKFKYRTLTPGESVSFSVELSVFDL